MLSSTTFSESVAPIAVAASSAVATRNAKLEPPVLKPLTPRRGVVVAVNTGSPAEFSVESTRVIVMLKLVARTHFVAESLPNHSVYVPVVSESRPASVTMTESVAGVADATIATGKVTVPRGRFDDVFAKLAPKPSAPYGSDVMERLSLHAAVTTRAALNALVSKRRMDGIVSCPRRCRRGCSGTRA